MVEESDRDSDEIYTDQSSSFSEPLVDADLDQIPAISTAARIIDEHEQFIYDEHLEKLICIGTDMETIPPAVIEEYAHRTKILDLSGNHFRSLVSLAHFVNLEELILDDNQLDENDIAFPRLPKLHSLMINKNKFEDIFQLIECLRCVYPELTHLSLLGNAACPYGLTHPNDSSMHLDEEYRRYRHLIIFRLPTLKFLDSQQISPIERRMAMQLGDILYAIAETKHRFR